MKVKIGDKVIELDIEVRDDFYHREEFEWAVSIAECFSRSGEERPTREDIISMIYEHAGSHFGEFAVERIANLVLEILRKLRGDE